MNPFQKHLLRSLRASPRQPLLILFTLMLSTVLCVCALSVSTAFVSHQEREAFAVREAGNIAITARADSPSRFLFAERAAEVLGADGTVLGEFVLSGYTATKGERLTLSLSALDLVQADRFYDFQYLAYRRIDEENLNRCAVLSTATAERLGADIGTEITVNVLGTALTLEVQAIAAESGLLAERDMLISYSCVRALLAQRTPAISSLGDAFAPCTRLLVKLQEPAKAQDVQARLLAHPDFEKSIVSVLGEGQEYSFFATLQVSFVLLFLLLILLLCLFVISTSLSLLHRQRATVYRRFASVGADPGMLARLLYGESLLYAILGALLGALLSLPASVAAGSLYPWQQQPLYPHAAHLCFGLLLTPLLMLLCTALHLRRHPIAGVAGEAEQRAEHTQRLTPKTTLLLPGILLLVLLVTLVLLPVGLRVLVALPAVLTVLWLLYASMPYLLPLATARLSRLFDKKRRPGGFVLTLRGMSHTPALYRVGSLLVAFICLFSTLFCCQLVFAKQIRMLSQDVPADLFAAHASEQTETALREDADVAECVRMTYLQGVQLSGDTVAIAISLSGDTHLFAEAGLSPAQIPTGREVVLSKGLAAKCGKRVGDPIALTFNGDTFDFTVSGILPINANFLYLDSTELGVAREMLCIRLAPECNRPAAEERVVALLEAGGAMRVEQESVFGNLPSSFEGHLHLMRYAILLCAVLGLVGSINLFGQLHLSEQADRHILHICGMTRTAVRGNALLKYAFALLFSLLIGLLGCMALLLLIHVGMQSFGLVLLL